MSVAPRNPKTAPRAVAKARTRSHPRDLEQIVAGWPRWARLLVPFVLGAVGALGHEDLPFNILAIFASLVLAGLLMPLRAKSAAWFGWLFGLGYFAITLRWLVEPFLVDVARHGFMAPFAIFLMAGGLALFWAAAFGTARRIAGQGAWAMLLLPVTLALAELARGHVLSGFPWGMASYTLIGSVGDVWFAWVGPYGTSFLLFAVAGITAFCLYRGWTLIWPALVVVLFATIGLQAVTPVAPDPSAQTVRLVQPNAPQHQKWDREWMPVFFDRAVQLTREGDAADVVIWPETSVPALLEYADPWLEEMARAARGAPIVAGIQRRTGDAFYNSAILLEGPTTVAAISDKAHLVPFGEYIPLAWLLEPIGLGVIVEQVAGFERGMGDGMMQVEGLGRVRVLICYEGIFPEDMQTGGPRADILMIITNDAWFGNFAGPRQHLIQAQARAIEQGLPVIRAANTGISAVIDARGTVVDSLALNEAGYLDSALPRALPPTLYSRIGDIPLIVLLLASMIGAILGRRRFGVDAAQPDA